VPHKKYHRRGSANNSSNAIAEGDGGRDRRTDLLVFFLRGGGVTEPAIWQWCV
jgi:hypothetical protein